MKPRQFQRLLQIAVGEHLSLRDIYFRIKAIEALGRMRVPEAAPSVAEDGEAAQRPGP